MDIDSTKTFEYVKLSDNIDLVLRHIPSGSFLMGSPDNEAGHNEYEGPQHRVTITKGFYMGIYPVTQDQWQTVMGSNPSYFKGDEHPVESVSWYDCQKFCSTLTSRLQKRFRLPTEAEWEYSCRAGTTTPYYT